MKRRKTAALLLAAIFILTALPVQAYAGSSTARSIKKLSDGTYYETVVTGTRKVASARKAPKQINRKKNNGTVTGTKAVYHKSKQGRVLWYVKVTGTFLYGSGTSKCMRASAKAVSKTKKWKILNKSSEKHDNKAIARASAKYLRGNAPRSQAKSGVKTMVVTLSCSPSGTCY